MFDWLESTSLALWVKESWGWPLALTIHAFGSATIFGISFLLGLRLLGVFQAIPSVSLRGLIPLFWIALGFQAVSGFLMALTTPTTYFTSEAFIAKMVLVLLGLIATMRFQGALKVDARMASSGTISHRAARFGALIVLAWGAVLILLRYSEKICPYSPPCYYTFSPSWTASLAVFLTACALLVAFALMFALDKKT